MQTTKVIILISSLNRLSDCLYYDVGQWFITTLLRSASFIFSNFILESVEEFSERTEIFFHK